MDILLENMPSVMFEPDVFFIERVGERVAVPVTIVVYVSLGPPEPVIEMRTVPNLVGRTMAEVDIAFQNAELIPDFLWIPDSTEEGTVVFIDKAGELVEISTTLIVHVSLGPPAPIEPPVETPPAEYPPETPYESSGTDEGSDDGQYVPQP